MASVPVGFSILTAVLLNTHRAESKEEWLADTSSYCGYILVRGRIVIATHHGTHPLDLCCRQERRVKGEQCVVID
jgi:hypothetical protein